MLDLSGAVVATLKTVEGETLSEVDVGPDGTIAVVDGQNFGYNGTPLGATIWDWRRDDVLLEVEGDYLSTELSPSAERVALAGLTSTAVLDVESGDELVRMTGFATPALDVTWSADGSRIATAHEDGEVRVWDAGTGESLARSGRPRRRGQARDLQPRRHSARVVAGWPGCPGVGSRPRRPGRPRP